MYMSMMIDSNRNQFIVPRGEQRRFRIFDSSSHIPTLSVYSHYCPSPFMNSILIPTTSKLDPNSKGTYELFTSLVAVSGMFQLKSEKVFL